MPGLPYGKQVRIRAGQGLRDRSRYVFVTGLTGFGVYDTTRGNLAAHMTITQINAHLGFSITSLATHHKVFTDPISKRTWFLAYQFDDGASPSQYIAWLGEVNFTSSGTLSIGSMTELTRTYRNPHGPPHAFGNRLYISDPGRGNRVNVYSLPDGSYVENISEGPNRAFARWTDSDNQDWRVSMNTTNTAIIYQRGWGNTVTEADRITLTEVVGQAGLEFYEADHQDVKIDILTQSDPGTVAITQLTLRGQVGPTVNAADGINAEWNDGSDWPMVPLGFQDFVADSASVPGAWIKAKGMVGLPSYERSLLTLEDSSAGATTTLVQREVRVEAVIHNPDEGFFGPNLVSFAYDGISYAIDGFTQNSLDNWDVSLKVLAVDG